MCAYVQAHGSTKGAKAMFFCLPVKSFVIKIRANKQDSAQLGHGIHVVSVQGFGINILPKTGRPWERVCVSVQFTKATEIYCVIIREVLVVLKPAVLVVMHHGRRTRRKPTRRHTDSTFKT